MDTLPSPPGSKYLTGVDAQEVDGCQESIWNLKEFRYIAGKNISWKLHGCVLYMYETI